MSAGSTPDAVKERLRPPNAADLRHEAWLCTGGDPTSTLSGGHGGSPGRVDEYGVTKADVHRAALEGHTDVFSKMAANLTAPSTRNNWTRSQRIPIWQNGKRRELDVPPQGKRLVTRYLARQLHKLVKGADWLPQTIVAFRDLKDFPLYSRRHDGTTIQDIFAGSVLELLNQHGPYAVTVDLKDAFGRLPLRAVNAALLALGLAKADRKWVIDLVRINSRRQDGHIVQGRHHGIEQGNPLSPLVFNITLAHVFNLAYGDGAPCRAASYGDDLVLVAPTDAAARADFDRLWRVMTGLGFSNVRRLTGTDPKRSRVYDTRVTAVPLIKTFLVTTASKDRAQSIRLAPGAERQLLKVAVPGDSVTSLRKKAKNNRMSKSYLVEVLNGLRGAHESSRHPGLKPGVAGQVFGVSPPGFHRSSKGMESSVSVSQEENAPLASPLPVAETQVSTTGEESGRDLVSTTGGEVVPIADPDGHEVGYCVTDTADDDVHLYDTAAIPSLKTEFASAREGTSITRSTRTPCLRGVSEGGVGSDCLSLTTPVSSARAKDLVASGGRGSRRVPGVLDTRGLAALPSSVLPFAIRRCLRLASFHGVARLQVDPSAQWVSDTQLLREPDIDGWQLVRVTDGPSGQVVKFRRVSPDRAHRTRPLAPPVADLVLTRSRLDVADRRVVHLAGTLGGQPATWQHRADSLTPRDAVRSAIASLLSQVNPRTVVVPNLGGLRDELTEDPARPAIRFRLVPAAQALRVLRRWSWSWTERSDWLVGERTSSVGSSRGQKERSQIRR